MPPTITIKRDFNNLYNEVINHSDFVLRYKPTSAVCANKNLLIRSKRTEARACSTKLDHDTSTTRLVEAVTITTVCWRHVLNHGSVTRYCFGYCNWLLRLSYNIHDGTKLHGCFLFSTYFDINVSSKRLCHLV